jgi:RHS repeat-associated protein
VTDITNGSGTVIDTFVYDVFGAVKTRTGTSVDAWKFTGEQADDGSGDSGYTFLRARYYDPAIGRFVGRDKLEFSQRYAYARNNPALVTDPLGLCGEIEEDCGGGGGFGGGGESNWGFPDWLNKLLDPLGLGRHAGGLPSAAPVSGLVYDLNDPFTIGEPGQPDVRVLVGDDARAFFGRHSLGGELAPHPTYQGEARVRLPDGTFMGLRESERFGLTIDVKAASGDSYRIHFK